MSIDWAALAIVSVVSILATLAFVVLLAFGVRCISVAKTATNMGGRASGAASLGYGCIGCAGLLVVYCIYLIVPQFH